MESGHSAGYTFEWDPEKAELNLRKHGIAFDEASTVFEDPLAMLMRDPDHSFDEERYVLMGLSNRHRLLVVAFGERSSRTRIISARRATASEVRRYEEEG